MVDLYDTSIEVDHKDEDKLNNSISNLQLLTIDEHKTKSII